MTDILHCLNDHQLTEGNKTHHHEFSVEILQQLHESVPLAVHLDDMQSSFEDKQEHEQSYEHIGGILCVKYNYLSKKSHG